MADRYHLDTVGELLTNDPRCKLAELEWTMHVEVRYEHASEPDWADSGHYC
jgi:hypothetical protein